MSPGRRRLLSLALGLVLAGGLWVALTAFTAPAPTRAPSFSLPRLGGGPRVRVPIVGEGAHDPVILTFFASWCGPCHAELPSVARVARQAEAAGDKVRFVGIDDNEKVAPGLAFVQASGVQFPVGRDWLSLTAPRYDIPGNPATVFIDADGDVAKTILGPVSTTTLESEIARLDRT
jgi:cytochrome c biogenesis protein CcmG/thiol:disulfide interchange protein DsbE